VATGAAGGSTAVGADSSLQTCTEPVGTVRLQDGMASAAPGARVEGSLDALRLLIQQSNCFVIVDRGWVESAANQEKQRARTSNEIRDDANMGQGQEVAADFVLRSSVISMGTKGSHDVNLGFLKKIASTGSVGMSTTEAKVQLVLADIRSKVQIAVAQGDGSGSNTRLATNVLGGSNKMLGGIGVRSESITPGTEILLQAFASAYNKIVPAVQNYKAQQVKGGLGAGGTLRVQGSRTDPSSGQK
jgi:hypothetical protein